MRLLITGGVGFIGSNYINWHLQQYPSDEIVCLDKLTYAANMAALADVVKLNNFTFIQGDICDEQFVESCFAQYKFDAVINFAAESHVDTSIISPAIFTKTNVEGTGVLLDACVKFAVEKFHQISTDEVYGINRLIMTGVGLQKSLHYSLPVLMLLQRQQLIYCAWRMPGHMVYM
ncbi:GDP-mannose 4,6-dehydratase [Phascolarctobacterium faecium]|nr:GDP-mannose 4,6-dehydratase [Phascolarctobacterium faecium]